MSWPVYLPFSTTVYVYGFVNAGLNQQIIVVPESGATLTFTGQGEGNNPTTPPTAIIKTPSTGQYLRGFQLLITINSWQNGSWVASQIAGNGCTIGITAAIYIVSSEDLVDQDWNDGVVQFIWYNPPEESVAFLKSGKTEEVQG